MRRIARIAMLVGTLLPALPGALWADSAQAALAISVVVPAICAVQVPGTGVPGQLSGVGTPEGVAMRCTKGTLPTTQGSTGAPGAIGPQITGSLIPPAGPASQPLSETGPLAAAETSAPGALITINF